MAHTFDHIITTLSHVVFSRHCNAGMQVKYKHQAFTCIFLIIIISYYYYYISYLICIFQLRKFLAVELKSLLKKNKTKHNTYLFYYHYFFFFPLWCYY